MPTKLTMTRKGNIVFPQTDKLDCFVAGFGRFKYVLKFTIQHYTFNENGYLVDNRELDKQVIKHANNAVTALTNFSCETLITYIAVLTRNYMTANISGRITYFYFTLIPENDTVMATMEYEKTT